MSYRVRIDEKVSFEDLMCFFEVFSDLVIVHHIVNDNPHFHAYIKTEKWKSPQSMRYSIRTRFQNLNKTDYSVKLCDEDRKDEYIQYMFNRKHGNIPTLKYSTIDITKHKERADEVANDFMEKYKNKDDVTNYDLSKMLAEYIRTNGLNQWNHDDKHKLVIQAIELHNKYGKAYCEFSLQRMITTAMGLTDWRTLVVDNVYQKLFVPRYPAPPQ